MNNVLLEEASRIELASCSAILGTLFVEKPSADSAQAVIRELCAANLEEWPIGSPEALAEAQALLNAGETDSEAFLDELSNDYQKLFVGPFALAAPPWGSVYLDYESVICGWSTAKLQEWMKQYGIVVERKYNEPEDHIGLMFMLLSWLASSRPELIPAYLKDHLCTWGPHFCDVMREKALTPFYQGIAVLARTTLTTAAEMAAVDIVEPKFYR